MLSTLILNTISFFYTLAPNGGQMKEVGKLVKKAAPYADDVVCTVSKNKSFLASISVWVWILIGIVVIAGVIYYVNEEC